ncbi:Structural maintenance of chromosomes protein 2 [Geranomyces michiganensis]|nr:Structural maintenance of chromosomes protein 2 [Geranomyces michiganensis]
MTGPTRTIHLPSTSASTPDIWLTETRATDAEAVFQILSSPEKGPKIYKMTGAVPHPYALENAHTFLQTMADRHAACGRVMTFAVRPSGDEGDLAGVIGVRVVALEEDGVISRAAKEGVLDIQEGAVEIGYWIDQDLAGKGVASRIAAEVVRIAREEMGVQVAACCFEENAASARVLTKSGLVYRGMTPQMHIEELIVEGFKSYATRTVISGWDPEFNAITGLNGSGKSNILDAICFVLGISTLSHVRANNLQDLVYKRGQAGITKASVTIVFNNADRERSPPGYENHKQISVTRQIIVNGRNKYIVNGHNKNQQDVANLFQSVQLNVNNPHFLIMQGRITKVLNMKPPEILAMIEEAAGTRMFEDRKEKANKTMAKKDAKLEEINGLLESEIGPKLEKLRAAKRTYLEYQRMSTELDHFHRLVTAHDYMQYETKLQTSAHDLEEKQDRISSLQQMLGVLKTDLEDIDVTLAELAEERERDSSHFKELEAAFKEHAKQLVKIKTQCDLKAGSIAEEQKNRDVLLAEKLETEKALAATQKKHADLEANFESSVRDHNDKTEAVSKLEDLVQTLSTGMAAKEGHENGYQTQLQETNKAISTAASEADQAKMKISHLKKELHEHLPKAKAAEAQNAALVDNLKANKAMTERLKNEMESLDFSPEREEELKQQKNVLKQTVNQLSEQIDSLERELAAFHFDYRDPTPNFDRSAVLGLVAQLVDISKDHADSATALELCAGGKLYNVVVRTEVVGSQLLANGKLRRRVTIIPLNKISAGRVSAERLNAAKKLAPGKVDLALNLVEFAKDVENAMNYVFGSALVCKDSETAKKVTFDKAVRMRSITLEGDTYDPSGQLSGGSKPKSSGFLLKLGKLRALKKQMDQQAGPALAEVERELEESGRLANHHKGLKQKLDMKLHETGLLEERLNTNASAKAIQLVQSLKSNLQEQEEARANALERKKVAEATKAHVESEMKEFSAHREDKLKALQADLDRSKKELAKSAPSMRKVQQEIDLSREETASLEKELAQTEEQLAALATVIQEYAAEEAELRRAMCQVKHDYDEAEAALNHERSSLSAYDTQTKELGAKKKDKKQMLEDCKLEVQKLTLELDRFNEERRNAARFVSEMDKSHPWIQDQKQLFGKQGTDYDFAKYDFRDVRKRVKQLEERHKSLERSLDHNVMDKFDRLEKTETQLTQKLATVKRDKRKIQETIGELDKYKREALRKTWEQVNQDFGSIFADLLPGNSARLDPPEDQDISQGLEVKVALGGVWKNSLTELSGGQRSLIALSLILSLLQYKPAPMYILDEVDSALDLSHTQNIGSLIRTRFGTAQFIVVSLKDGMFNNANTLFRTKFRDGVSNVERTSQRDKVTPPTTRPSSSAKVVPSAQKKLPAARAVRARS